MAGKMSDFSGLEVHEVRTWNIESFVNLALAISGDGATAVTCGEDKDIAVWDLVRKGLPKTLRGHRTDPVCLTISDDGSHALSGDVKGTICFWDVHSAKLVCELAAHKDRVSSVAFGPKLKTAVSGSWDGTIGVWDVERRQSKSVLKGHTQGISDVAISPNERFAISSGFDSTVRVWDLEAFEQISELPGHHGKVMAAAIAPNGTRLATGGADGTLALSDFPVTKLRVLGPLNKGICSLAFDPSGTMLFIAHYDGTISLLDTVGQALTTLLEVHGRLPASLSVSCDIGLSSDGRRLLVGRAGSVGLFEVKLPQSKPEIRSHVRSLGDEDGPTFPTPPSGNTGGMMMITGWGDRQRSRVKTRLVLAELSEYDLEGRAAFHFGKGDVFITLRDGSHRDSLGTMFSMNVGTESSESFPHALLLHKCYVISVDGESCNLDDPGGVSTLSDDPYYGPLCRRTDTGSIFVMAFPATTPFEDAVSLTIGDIEISISEEEKMTTRPTARDEFSRWVQDLERVLDRRTELIVAGLTEDTPSPQSIWSSGSSLTEISAESFLALHKAHVEALKKRDLHEAAEALKTIFEFSERHDNNQWARRQRYAVRPQGDPAQLSDAFSYGPVICCYIGGEYKSRSPKYRDRKGHLIYFHRQDSDEEIMDSLYEIFGRHPE